jgi:hypothetical protein
VVLRVEGRAEHATWMEIGAWVTDRGKPVMGSSEKGACESHLLELGARPPIKLEIPVKCKKSGSDDSDSL